MLFVTLSTQQCLPFVVHKENQRIVFVRVGKAHFKINFFLMEVLYSLNYFPPRSFCKSKYILSVMN